MKKKHLNSYAREIAMQALYQIELGQKSIDEVLELKWRARQPEQEIIEYTSILVRGVYDTVSENTKILSKFSHKSLSQISTIVQAILQIGIFELKKNLQNPIVIIDDLLNLVRKYDGEESVGFVNGILDSFHKELFPAISQNIGTYEKPSKK